MVAKYFTATYGTKPWAEVDDAACLRCHERRLLEGRVDFHGVAFDHRPHLTESRRGLRLRCTSCHSQIVQGTHLTVTVSTCALCHFKGKAPNTGIGACRTLPHGPGRVKTPAGHDVRPHAGRDVRHVVHLVPRRASCAATGRVPTRALPELPQPARSPRALRRPASSCTTCTSPSTRWTARTATRHRARHRRRSQPVAAHTGPTSAGVRGLPRRRPLAAADLYAGIGGRGVPPSPEPDGRGGRHLPGLPRPGVLRARGVVRPREPRDHPRRRRARACPATGPRTGASSRAGRKAPTRARTRCARRWRPRSAAMGAAPSQAWDDARWNFALVNKGRGIHNINYAYRCSTRRSSR